jgi:hypothetical protein
VQFVKEMESPIDATNWSSREGRRMHQLGLLLLLFGPLIGFVVPAFAAPRADGACARSDAGHPSHRNRIAVAKAQAGADGLRDRILDGCLRLLRKLGSHGTGRRMGRRQLDDAGCRTKPLSSIKRFIRLKPSPPLHPRTTYSRSVGAKGQCGSRCKLAGLSARSRLCRGAKRYMCAA